MPLIDRQRKNQKCVCEKPQMKSRMLSEKLIRAE